MIDVHMLTLGMFQSNCFIVSCTETREGVVIDAGDEGEVILNTIDKLHINITAILETHAHVDHVGALAEVKPALGVPVYMHKDEIPLYGTVSKQAAMFGLEPPRTVTIDNTVEDGDEIRVGNLTAKVIHTPGHSPGGVCYHFADQSPPRIVVGDVLFKGSIGRTDLPGGSYQTIMETLKNKFLPLPGDTIVYSGHGPETTIAEEKKFNPFFAPLAQGGW
ncbi:MAG: MBL fold metallo-hydrolase [Candidatus Latescibacterota bacterium]|jgi:glyoxylase-like metal-dependent hydrolase (beta-lactamase superfamily II)